MRYRKKPIEVDAVRFWRAWKIPDGVITIVPKSRWWRAAWEPLKYGIQTLEGFMEVSDGDYIITGVAGEKYPCKPHIFLHTYEDATVKLIDNSTLFKLLNSNVSSVSVNMDNTFGLASAWKTSDTEEVDISDLPKLSEVYQKFGRSGVDAFAALQRDTEVMDHPALRTPLYYAAKEYLNGYEFHGYEYTMRKFYNLHPEEKAKELESIAEEEKIYQKKLEIHAAGHSVFKCIKEWFKK